MLSLLLLELDDGFHFYRNSEGQSVCSNGRSSVISFFLAKDIHDQIRASIHNQVLLCKIVGGVDNTEDLAVVVKETRQAVSRKGSTC